MVITTAPSKTRYDLLRSRYGLSVVPPPPVSVTVSPTSGTRRKLQQEQHGSSPQELQRQRNSSSINSPSPSHQVIEDLDVIPHHAVSAMSKRSSIFLQDESTCSHTTSDDESSVLSDLFGDLIIGDDNNVANLGARKCITNSREGKEDTSHYVSVAQQMFGLESSRSASGSGTAYAFLRDSGKLHSALLPGASSFHHTQATCVASIGPTNEREREQNETSNRFEQDNLFPSNTLIENVHTKNPRSRAFQFSDADGAAVHHVSDDDDDHEERPALKLKVRKEDRKSEDTRKKIMNREEIIGISEGHFHDSQHKMSKKTKNNRRTYYKEYEELLGVMEASLERTQALLKWSQEALQGSTTPSSIERSSSSPTPEQDSHKKKVKIGKEQQGNIKLSIQDIDHIQEMLAQNRRRFESLMTGSENDKHRHQDRETSSNGCFAEQEDDDEALGLLSEGTGSNGIQSSSQGEEMALLTKQQRRQRKRRQQLRRERNTMMSSCNHSNSRGNNNSNASFCSSSSTITSHNSSFVQQTPPTFVF